MLGRAPLLPSIPDLLVTKMNRLGGAKAPPGMAALMQPR